MVSLYLIAITVERRVIFYLPMVIATCLCGCKRGKREKAIFMYKMSKRQYCVIFT